MSFYYLATPYSKYLQNQPVLTPNQRLEMAFQAAAELTATLAMAGVPVYSPICHSHPVAVWGRLDAVDHDFWRRFDAPMVAAAGGIIVAQLPGWNESRGVLAEIEDFLRACKPIVYWNPHDPVPELAPL